LRDPRLDRRAEVFIRHCAPVKKGDLVAIVSGPSALPAVEATFHADSELFQQDGRFVFSGWPGNESNTPHRPGDSPQKTIAST
jgi:hypothetical protein